MSVSLLVDSLPYWNETNVGISHVLDEISFRFFWRYYWDVGTIATNNSEFHVCLSLCLFAYFLTKITQKYIYRSGGHIFLKFFEDIPETLVHGFQKIQIFFVCVSLFFGILPEWNPYNLEISPALDDISFWMFIHLFNIILML